MPKMPNAHLIVVETPGRDVVGPVKPNRVSQRRFRDECDSTKHYVWIPAHTRPNGVHAHDTRIRVAGAVSAAVIARTYPDAAVTIWPCGTERPTLEVDA